MAEYINPQWRLPNEKTGNNQDYSMDFDNKFINIGNASFLNGLSQFSISIWFNIDINQANKCLIADWNHNTSPFGHFSLISTNASGSGYGLMLYVKRQNGNSDPGGNRVATARIFTKDTWYHAVFAYDGNLPNSSRVTCYIDGSPVSLGVTGTIPSTLQNEDGDLNIGKWNGLNYTWDGKLNEVCIFDYALDQDQATYLHNLNNPMALASPPINYYPLGNSAHMGSNYLTPNGALQDYVFDFNGSSNVVDAGTGLTITRDLTLSGWVKFTSTNSGGSTVICKHINAYAQPYYTYRLYIDSNKAAFRIGITTYTIITGGTDINDGNWHHILGTYDGSNINLYVDGVSDATAVAVSGDLNTAVKKTTIGAVISGNTGSITSNSVFNGELSNAQIFNTALSGPEVETLYNYGSPIQTLASIPQSSNLKAWYKLDTTEIYDSSTTEWDVNNSSNPSMYNNFMNFNNSWMKVYPIVNQGGPILPDNFTISWWVKMNSGSAGFFEGELQTGADNNWNMFRYNSVQGSTGQYKLFFAGAVTSNIIDNNWHHILLTYDSSTTTLKVYTDNLETFSSSSRDYGTGINITRIGSGSDGNSRFTGNMSNISIWESVTTTSQRDELYNNGAPKDLTNNSNYSNLRHWWVLNNKTTGIQDQKGSNNLQAYAAHTPNFGFINTLAGKSSGMSQSNLVQSDLLTTSSYSPYALSFNSAQLERIDTGAKILNNMTSYTASIWAKGWSTSTLSAIMSQYDGGSVSPLILTARHSSNTNGFTAWLTIGGTFYTSHNDEGFSDNTKWVNLTVTWDGSDLILYVNGIAGGVTPASGTIDNSTTYNFHIGGYSNVTSNSYNGELSNCAIWNTALSTAQVREVYNEGLPSNLHNFSGTAPVAWWQLGSNSSYTSPSWTVLDEIGSNNGTSTNMLENAIVDGVGTSGNGVSTNMGSANNISGSSPNGEGNSLSVNMTLANIAGGVN